MEKNVKKERFNKIAVNRTNKILELLTSEKRIEVSQLAEYLGVSQVTIRKDLDALEAKGIICAT